MAKAFGSHEVLKVPVALASARAFEVTSLCRLHLSFVYYNHNYCGLNSTYTSRLIMSLLFQVHFFSPIANRKKVYCLSVGHLLYLK